MARLSIYRGERIAGRAYGVPIVAALVMGFWVMRVIVWPDAFLEAAVVIPMAFIVLWRFLRIGIWLDGDLLVVRNTWETIRVPVSEATLRAGYVDDISEFDRFTGGYANQMRLRVGDQFADRSFLRHRLVVDGVEHELDAFLGRTPKGQRRVAEALKTRLRFESFS